MNRPFKSIPAALNPLESGTTAPASPSPVGVGATSIGAGENSSAQYPNGEAGAPNRSKIHGPLTTSRMEGAGGPFNRWDIDIAAAKRRGNHQLAERLQAARARINLAFEQLEPVWVPTQHQRTMLALQAEAAANGFASVAA